MGGDPEARLDEDDVVYRATHYTGDFVGIADFLVVSRDDVGAPRRAPDGRLIYEPMDAKSAMSAKRAAAHA